MYCVKNRAKVAILIEKTSYCIHKYSIKDTFFYFLFNFNGLTAGNRTFEPHSKALPLGFPQINLENRSLNRTFAPQKAKQG